MRNLIIFTMLTLSGSYLKAQDNAFTTQKKIEVTGTAEIEVIPDEIYLRIALKEYKAGSRKIDVNTLELGLVYAIKKIGLTKENLQVDNIYGYHCDFKEKKSVEFLAIKSFVVKLSDVKQINNLLELLDAEGVNSTGISKYTHSKIDQYTKELKIKALKAAKNKAAYLLEAIGQSVGQAIEIQEVEHGYQPVYQRSNLSFAKRSTESDYQSNLEFKPITIRAEMRAVFSIQ